MKVLFRADANHYIGMGHIMRCLSIADAFSSSGHHISFLLADDTVECMIKNRGYEVLLLHSDYSRMEEEKWPSVAFDMIIIDSYYVTESYVGLLREATQGFDGKLIYIDDVCAFPYPVDVLINYNVYASPAAYNELYRDREMPSMILGPAYAPLRSMFKGLQKKVQPEKVNNILISTGGSDELHLVLCVVKSLSQQRNSERTYHILLGAMNTDKEEIKKLAGENIVFHENVTDMKTLIEGMDLAVSAAGSTLYEICACGVPLITFSTADNQISGAEAFERLGLGINIGDLREPATINKKTEMPSSLSSDAVDIMMVAIETLSMDYKKRLKMGIRMQKMVDGYGAERIVQRLAEVSRDMSFIL